MRRDRKYKLLGSALLVAAIGGCTEDPVTRYLENPSLRMETHGKCQELDPSKRLTADCKAARKAHEQVAMEMVKHALKDPESARFTSFISAWATEA